MEFPEIAILWNARAGVEPALDSFGILSASVYVKSPISEGCQLSVLPIEHTAHHALIIQLSTQIRLDSINHLS